jgi:uncharacterized membrane protein YqgA involved in biofilm formation
MAGTIVNAAAIVLGALAGLLLRKGPLEPVGNTIMLVWAWLSDCRKPCRTDAGKY